MSEKFGHLESLVRIAKETSPDKRRELLREVTDLFLEAPEELNEREKDHFAAIIGKIAFELEMEVRKHLAEKFAAIDAAPHRLAIHPIYGVINFPSNCRNSRFKQRPFW